MPNRLLPYSEGVAEKLDEMADLCEYWKSHRNRGYDPMVLRPALLMLAMELTQLSTPPDLRSNKKRPVAVADGDRRFNTGQYQPHISKGEVDEVSTTGNEFDHPDNGSKWRDCEVRWIKAKIAEAVAAEREACAAECERMVMYPGGRQEAPAHNYVWAAADAIRKRT